MTVNWNGPKGDISFSFWVSLTYHLDELLQQKSHLSSWLGPVPRVRKVNTLEKIILFFWNTKMYIFSKSPPPASFLHKFLNIASFGLEDLASSFLFYLIFSCLPKPYFFSLQQFLHSTNRQYPKIIYSLKFYCNCVSCLSTTLFQLLISFHIKYQMFIMDSTWAGNLAKIQWGDR